MRGLTVRQPWAWAIVHGGKDVENRTRSLGPYRGLVAIHAGLMEAYLFNEQIKMLARLVPDWNAVTQPGEDPWQHRPDGARGAVIGVVDLVDVHHALRTTGPDEPTEMCSEWAQDGDLYHLVLRDPRPLTHPIPWRGRLGLWTVPDDLEAAIRADIDGSGR